MADMAAVFGRSDKWLFLGGHFDGHSILYNEHQTVTIRFDANSVMITRDSASETLRKNQEFQQHKNLKALFWGGCNVHGSEPLVRMLRGLFGNVLMIGWVSTTGGQILHSIMGGFGNQAPHASKDFFQRLGQHSGNAAKIRTSWLQTANATSWGAPPPEDPEPYRDRFSVIGPSGQEWILGPNGPKKGRRF